MKKLLLTAVAVLLILLKPAFASNALGALSVLAYFFWGAIAFGALGVVFSIVAYRTNKRVWKVLSALPTIALLLGGFFIVSLGDVPLIGFAMIAVAAINILLVTKARARTVVNNEPVAPR